MLGKYGGRIAASNQAAEMRMAQQEDAKLLARQQAGKPEASLLESLDTLLRAVNPLEKWTVRQKTFFVPLAREPNSVCKKRSKRKKCFIRRRKR